MVTLAIGGIGYGLVDSVEVGGGGDTAVLQTVAAVDHTHYTQYCTVLHRPVLYCSVLQVVTPTAVCSAGLQDVPSTKYGAAAVYKYGSAEVSWDWWTRGHVTSLLTSD